MLKKVEVFISVVPILQVRGITDTDILVLNIGLYRPNTDI